MGRRTAAFLIAVICLICLLTFTGRFSNTSGPNHVFASHVLAPDPGERGPDREKEDDERLLESELEENPQLTEAEMDGLKKLALFVGHARSCHTFVGSMLNAHPHMHIGVSFNLLTYFMRLGSDATRELLLQAMYKSALFNRDSSRSNERKGYSFRFEGLYQGTYKDHLDVIGAQRGGKLARLNLNSPTKCKTTLAGLRHLTRLPLYLIRIIRNPFDIVSTQVLYAGREAEEVRTLKSKLRSSGETYSDPELVSSIAEDYFDMLQSTEEVLHLANKSMDVHCRDLVSNPKVEIRRMCDFFEVECPKEYIEKSAAMVFPEESKTSELVEWPEEARDYVRKQLSGDRFPYLRRYLDE